MEQTDERIFTAIKRREPLELPFLRISTILEVGDVGMYLSLCNERVEEAELIDGEDVRIDFMNFPDLLLTADGVRICRDILECYVSDDIIADAFEALCWEEVSRAAIDNLAQILREMKLRELLRAYIKSDMRTRRFVIAEFFQRSALCKCMRKMHSMIRGAIVKVKYHDLISACRRIAADEVESS